MPKMSYALKDAIKKCVTTDETQDSNLLLFGVHLSNPEDRGRKTPILKK